jgi:putative phage-type endonuclease
MIVIDCEQGSEEWFAARCGRATASRMGDLMARGKSGWLASRTNYAAELIAERLTGKPAERYSNAAMAWGTQHEPEARALYEFLHDCEVRTVGLVTHPTIAMSLASPDGLVGADGLVEIKAPNTSTHLQNLLGGGIDGRYLMQMAWQMACTGRAWCDFVSYDPRLPAEMQMHVTRVKRDDDMIENLEREVIAFLAEVEVTVETLRTRYQLRGQLEASLARTEAA